MQPEFSFRRLKISVPVKVAVRSEEGVKEFSGQLKELGEGNAQICLAQPLAEGTELSVMLELKDTRNRGIRLRYEGRVVSAVNDPCCEVTVDFEEGVGISGESAMEILAELFPKQA